METNLKFSLMPAMAGMEGPVKCVNLMPAPDGCGLVPAAPPVAAPVPGGWEVLANITVGGSDRLLARSGDKIGIVARGRVDNPFTLDGAPCCVVQSGDHILVMTEKSAWRLAVGARLELQRVDADTPAMPVLTAVAASPAHITIPAITLGREYGSGEALSPADTSRLRAAAVEAYESIDREVRAAGMFWHPVIAYVRALDINGEEVVATEPKLLCHPSGAESPENIVFTSEDHTTTNPVNIEVARWSLQVAVPPVAGGLSTIVSYEVVCTPMLYASDPTLQPFVDRPRRADNTAFCAVGFQRSAVAPPARTGTSRAIYCLLGQLGAIGMTAARMSASDGGSIVAVASPSTGSVASQLALIVKSLATKTDACDYATAMFAPPHSFTARRAARSGGCIAWGDLTVERFRGWDARHFASSVGPGSWHGTVEVTFNDGSSRVRSIDATGECPAAFSPVVTYPAPDAVALTITISSGGHTRRLKLPLTTDPSGRRSVYVSPSLKPIVADEELEGYVVATERPARISLPSRIATADAATPLRLRASAALASGNVAGLAPMHTGQSSWDYGRTRFYAFSTAGIHSLSTDVARKTLSLSLLDSRIVAADRAASVCEEGVAAVASGDIVMMSGSKVSRIADIPGTKALVWVHTHHELWCIGDTFTKVVCFDHGKDIYELSELYDPERSGNGYLIRASDGVCCSAGHGSGNEVDFEWRGVLDVGRFVKGLSALELYAGGDFSALRLDVSRESMGAVAPRPELSLSLSGSLSAPLRKRIWHAPLRRMDVHIKGKASACLLHGVEFIS